jgi:NAD(P)-dependent dehydrogenase (short-subunit alcohol dehydrogenase family)
VTQIKGKAAFITGGASGIGLAMAHAFTDRGGRVVIADIDIDRAQSEAEKLDGAHAVKLDVTDGDDWLKAADEARASVGPISILCNNAGVGGGPGTLDTYDPAIWRWLYDVNVTALLHSARTFLPEMKASGRRCHIVNTASMSAIVPTPNAISYVSSKFAVVGLTVGLRTELEKYDIGVSMLCPGMTATRIVETTGGLRPDDNRGGFTEDGMKTMTAVMNTGMRPDAVGEMVARSIETDEFYIFPSPEWKPMAECFYAEILSGFRESAQPGHADDLNTFLKTWGRTEMFGYRLEDH